MEHELGPTNSGKSQSGDLTPFLDIGHVVEQRVFEQPSVRELFAEWCDANGSEPQFVEREEWNDAQAGDRILSDEPEDNSKRRLLVPTDLQLYEMVDVMRALDRDFQDHPERAADYHNKISQLGRTLTDAGVYIAQRRDAINDPGAPRQMADQLAQQFYNYGRSLVTGEQEEAVTVEAVAEQPPLAAERLEELDRWLAGDRLYEARRARVLTAGADQDGESDPFEEQRRQTLDQFFRTVAKSYALQTRDHELKSAEGRDPWKSDLSAHAGLTQKIESQIAHQIEVPKQELMGAVLRRGLDRLQSKMGIVTLDSLKGTVLNVENGESTLAEALQLDDMKAQLEALGPDNIAEKADLETQIADRIQAATSEYWFTRGAARPADILESEELNCAGASALGGALMRRAGLKYLVAEVPGHSSLILVKSDQQAEWRDMVLEKVVPLQDAGIADFSRQTSPASMHFLGPVKLFPKVSQGYRKTLPITAAHPDEGHRAQLAAWVGIALNEQDRADAALEAYQESIVAMDAPNNYVRKAHLLYKLHREGEAIDCYQKAIAIDPEDASIYSDLGASLERIGQTEQANKAYRKAAELKAGVTTLASEAV